MPVGTDLTVLMPVYAGARPDHLRAALSSLLAQTEAPAEILVVEDGPLTPAHRQVLDEAADGSPIRRLPLAEHVGLAKALQAGMASAQTEWLARMDADDLALPDRFAKQLAELGRADHDVLGSAMHVFSTDGQHRVSDAVALVDRARCEGVDVVLGSRFLGEGSDVPRSRRALLRGAVYFTRVTSGLALSDAHNGLRAFSRRAASQIHITLNGMAHASEILDQIAAHRLSWVEHPVTIDYTDYSRGKGQSNINAINISWDLIGRRLRTAGRG